MGCEDEWVLSAFSQAALSEVHKAGTHVPEPSPAEEL